ncbi:SNARE-interacting protein KEULE [Hirschfeldia incana]|nr:SNARE-interacting protein KEULE [Hirschfeldia incana]
MSYSDSDSSSSQAGEYKTFRQLTRERLLYEMLRSTKTGSSTSTWKVLIMDKLTVKIMSHACKMADITDEGVSLVEDIFRRRQPLPSLDAIYFIQPTKENVIMFLSDMSGKSPLYKKAFVFFSSPVSKELVGHIKKDSSVLPRIAALREMNLEFFAIDSQGFISDHERALEDLFGDEETSQKGDACLNVMASRIATVFASLREFPTVRYRAAKSLDASTMTTLRDLIPTKLAAGIWNCLAKHRQSIENFPQTETCELLILDRSIDQIAPIIHEWTYDAMCHDLLNMEGNKYVHVIPSNSGGQPETKDVLLEEHDPIWLELRHAHIADASERLSDKMTNFLSKNKAAQLQHGKRDGGELSTRDLQKMVQALPQYSEQIDKLSLHVEIARKINDLIREQGLRELGQLEQDLVFGDAGMKDVIKYLSTQEEASREGKLRLLMILATIYPEKFEGEKGQNLMKLAKLSSDDMSAVNNMRLLGSAVDAKKNTPRGFTLKFDLHKKKRAVRKERQEEAAWQLSRFYPMIEELIEKLSKGELPKEDYPCMNDPSPSFHGSTSHSSSAASSSQGQAAQSMRSRRTPTWAKPRGSDDGYSSDSVLRHSSSDFKKMGQRIFVFIVGGATRSELKVCHKLTTKLKREVILGSTSLDDPPQFITKLKLLTANELSIDDLQI